MPAWPSCGGNCRGSVYCGKSNGNAADSGYRSVTIWIIAQSVVRALWRDRDIDTMQPHQAEQFAALWTAAQPTIAGFIRTLIPDYLQADEVLQRVAVTLVRKFAQYD